MPQVLTRSVQPDTALAIPSSAFIAAARHAGLTPVEIRGDAQRERAPRGAPVCVVHVLAQLTA